MWNRLAFLTPNPQESRGSVDEWKQVQKFSFPCVSWQTSLFSRWLVRWCKCEKWSRVKPLWEGLSERNKIKILVVKSFLCLCCWILGNNSAQNNGILSPFLFELRTIYDKKKVERERSKCSTTPLLRQIFLFSVEASTWNKKHNDKLYAPLYSALISPSWAGKYNIWFGRRMAKALLIFLSY